MADTLAINGTSLATLGRVVSDFGSALAGAPEVRGESETIPRRFGVIDTDHATGARVVIVQMVVTGKTASSYTRGAYHDTLRALTKLVFNRGRSFTLTRTIDAASGTLTHTATARYLRGLEPQQVAAHASRLAFELEILDGYFYDTAATDVAPGTFTVPGDADTRLITLNLPGAGTLTNTTLGVSVTVTTGGILDVQAFTATAGIDTLSWSGDDYWFVLAPGSNTVTWSGAGTPTVSYRAAWL